MAAAYQLQFRLYGIYAIQHIIISRQIHLVGVLWQVKHREHFHLTGWGDVLHPLPSHLHLQPSHRGMGGDNLPVDIRLAHEVIVIKMKRSHSTPCQCLHGIAAHAAYAKNRHLGSSQDIQGGVAH